jgi:hypothetical protein
VAAAYSSKLADLKDDACTISLRDDLWRQAKRANQRLGGLVRRGQFPHNSNCTARGPANTGTRRYRRDFHILPHAASSIWTKDLQADACGPSYKYGSLTRLQIEKKEDMRRRGVPSPDGWDTVALTFAEPVVEPSWQAVKPRSMSWVV